MVVIEAESAQPGACSGARGGYYRIERRRLLDGRLVTGTAVSEEPQALASPDRRGAARTAATGAPAACSAPTGAVARAVTRSRLAAQLAAAPTPAGCRLMARNLSGSRCSQRKQAQPEPPDGRDRRALARGLRYYLLRYLKGKRYGGDRPAGA